MHLLKQILFLLVFSQAASSYALNQVDSGILHMDGAQGQAYQSNDSHILDYTLPKHSSIGTWYKLSKNPVKDYLVFHLESKQNLDALQLKIELKGTRGIQSIPISSQSQKILIDEDTLGELRELVFLAYNNSETTSKGQLNFDFSLANWPSTELKQASYQRDVITRLANAQESGALAMDGATCYAVEPADNSQSLQFALPANSIAGFWSKQYPQTINKSQILSFTRSEHHELDGLSFSLELKGSKTTQILNLSRAHEEILIDWNHVGELNELVFLIHNPSSKLITQELSFDIHFQALTIPENLATKNKFISLLIFVFIMAVLFKLLKKIPFSKLSQRAQVFTHSLILALIISCAFLGYGLSDFIALQRAPYMLALFAMNAAILILLKITYQSRLPNFKETFTHTLFPGFIIISISSNPVWHTPNSWSDLFKIGGFGAAILLVLYHCSHLYLIKTFKKSLSSFSSAVIISLPIIFSLLLSLQNADLLLSLASDLPDKLKSWSYYNPIALALLRFGIVFFIVEFTINALSYITNKHVIYDRNAHKKLIYLCFSLGLSPFIADLGSADFLLNFPRLVQAAFAVITTAFSQGMLWAFVFMITGVLLDAIKGQGPAAHTIHDHAATGRGNGRMYAGSLMLLIQILHIFGHWQLFIDFYNFAPLLVLSLSLSLLYPLIKTIIESFDGSHSFLQRSRDSYKDKSLYMRGLIVGIALALAIHWQISEQHTGIRALFGLVAGALAFAGINKLNKKGGESIKSSLIAAIQGGFIGAAIAFYLDAGQIPVVLERFNKYNTFGIAPQAYQFDNLLSKWGHISLGDYTGGSKLLFNQALNGVIGWGVAAWLFALNQSLLTAIFKKNSIHLKRLASREGAIELAEGTIRVLRWGLWMSPIIFTFLRQMPEATWYNQDGAVHTLFCIGADLTMSSDQFHSWSLEIFMWIMAYEGFRILIWLDHMGLRVATLVNLSFIGMDDLDTRFSRFIDKTGKAGSVIPEGVKRFMTWAPLLIPYYIPRSGQDWDYAWTTALGIQDKAQPLVAASISIPQIILLITLLTVILFLFSCFKKRRSEKAQSISNQQFQVSLNSHGQILSSTHGVRSNITVSRHQNIDHKSQASSFLIQEGERWFKLFDKAEIKKENGTIIATQSSNEFTFELTLDIPVKEDAVCFMNLKIKNLKNQDRSLRLMPYFEWCLDNMKEDLLRQAEQRESQEVLLEPGSNALYALQPTTSMVGFLASKSAPDKYLRHKLSMPPYLKILANNDNGIMIPLADYCMNSLSLKTLL
ncbi:hypothetical protein PQO03_03880 [Lentisphaera profundi]|uniref:Glycosyl hydrolase 94 supersandwich domain-containing protein n=1 Tax=Lentisphaera profundi TaxID=1658616 RepID=A0ABY7VSB8_9BACT|nr:hypothetical protein [Lentisphaera profundi]WDE97095.1 hypothetical protein PQO03_03880 [Lentisphaera profundi]